jgi:dTDP-4-amino-4,6-dideoxygalactose transaminase
LAVKLPSGCSLDGVVANLKLFGIETRRWYCPPCHMHPLFFGRASGAALPITNDLSLRLLGLPYHLFLTEEDVATVCARLAEAVLIWSQR